MTNPFKSLIESNRIVQKYNLFERIQELKRKINEDPNSIVIFNQLAEEYNLTCQYNQAIKCYDKIIKEEIKSKPAYNNLFYAI